MLKSRTIWICASCETCSTRCPNGVRIAELMDYFKELALNAGITPALPAVAAFYQTFLANLKLTGRVYETGLLPAYWVRSGQVVSRFMSGEIRKDIGQALKLFKKRTIVHAARLSQGKKRNQVHFALVSYGREMRMMKATYYPGCSLEGASRDYADSIEGVCALMDIELPGNPRLELLRGDGCPQHKRRASYRAAPAQPETGSNPGQSGHARPLPALFQPLKDRCARPRAPKPRPRPAAGPGIPQDLGPCRFFCNRMKDLEKLASQGDNSGSKG